MRWVVQEAAAQPLGMLAASSKTPRDAGFVGAGCYSTPAGLMMYEVNRQQQCTIAVLVRPEIGCPLVSFWVVRST
jgi:hypothetical protein